MPCEFWTMLRVTTDYSIFTFTYICLDGPILYVCTSSSFQCRSRVGINDVDRQVYNFVYMDTFWQLILSTDRYRSLYKIRTVYDMIYKNKWLFFNFSFFERQVEMIVFAISSNTTWQFSRPKINLKDTSLCFILILNLKDRDWK